MLVLLALPVWGIAHAQSVTYQVTFKGQWTTTATPGGVPGGAHFSPLIGAVHNDQVTFWSAGGTASAGIESMAEVGGTGTLKSEINASEHARSVIERSGNIGATGSATVNITLTPTHPLVTLVTMVAPSPDWFVGVSDLSLLDSQNAWRASHTVELFPYDAGTEDGTEFSLSNPATSPQGTITSIQGMGKFSSDPIATLTFTKVPALAISTLVSGLYIPWGLAFTPDGTLLFTERLLGALSVRRPDGTVRRVTADFDDLFRAGESGLMAIVVDPDFATNRRFYTCQAHTGPEVQVIAWTMNAAYTQATRVNDPLVGGLPLTSSGRHGGCRLRFGPNGYLWIATGDAATHTTPQDLTSLGGKVLRVNASDGTGAAGNPSTSAPLVYTYGHRNVQGLALRPGTTQMWAVEHGPAYDDEINLLTAGGNYGWDPGSSYNENVPMTDLTKFPGAIEAKWSSGNRRLAPSGGIFLEGSDWDGWEGRLAVASLGDRSLRLFAFDAAGTLESETVVPELHRTYGRLRTPMLGPDGALYITTSNHNSPSQDKILRVAPNESVITIARASGGAITEGSPARFTLTARPAPTASLTVNLRVADDGTSDFVAGNDEGSQMVTVDTSGSATFSVSTEDDNNDEPNGEVTVRVTSGDYTVGTPNSAAVTVNDDDAPTPVASFTTSTASVNENAGTRSVSVTLNPRPVMAFTLHYTVGGTATEGSDYASLSRTVAVSSGASSVTIPVSLTDDSADEQNETIELILLDDSAYNLGSPDVHTLTILDNDVPQITISGGSGVTEGSSATFTLSANPVPAVPLAVSVNITQSGAFAASGQTGPQTVTVGTNGSTTFSVSTDNDNVDEADGSITATVRTGMGYTPGSPKTASVTVQDDDVPAISISGGSKINEGNSATFTLSASPVPAAALAVSVSITQSGDFTSATGTRTVNVGTGGSATFSVSTDNDNVDEADGSITATVETGMDYTIGSPNAHTLTVLDNDSPGISAQPLDLTVTEGGGRAATRSSSTPTRAAP